LQRLALRALLYVSLNVNLKLVRASETDTVADIAKESFLPCRFPIKSGYVLDRITLYGVGAGDALTSGV